MAEETKICNGICGNPLPLSSFYLCPTSADGHAGICIQCQKAKVYEIRERRRQAGLTVKGELPKRWARTAEQMERDGSFVESEQAVEREREKRQAEKEIAFRLTQFPGAGSGDSTDTKEEFCSAFPEFESSRSVFRGLTPTRKGKKTFSWKTV